MNEARVTQSQIAEPADVLSFWRALGPDKWFTRDAELDALIRHRYLPTHRRAIAGDMSDWEQTAGGALALILVLDQFPRNMFRGSSDAFATDALALGAARGALLRGHDLQIAPPARQFFYLPLMHSDALADQDRCRALFRERMPDPGNVRHAAAHREVIRRFGRFPYRNPALGRANTPAERVFLAGGGYPAVLRELEG